MKLEFQCNYGRTLKHSALPKKRKSQQKEGERWLREKRVQRGKPTGGEREGNADFCCGFIVSSLSLTRGVPLW